MTHNTIEVVMKTIPLTAKIVPEQLSTGETIYVAVCLELDIASQGRTVEEAKRNVTDAVASFLESASPAEKELRLPKTEDDVFLTRIAVPFGQTEGLVGAGRV
jgi:predicted RNase H-like HicB family nuclease